MEIVSLLIGLAFILVGVACLSQLFQKRWRSAFLLAGLEAVLFIVIGLIGESSPTSNDDGRYANFSFTPGPTVDPNAAATPNDTATDDDAAPAATDPPPPPTAKPESYQHQRLREKREFLTTVDESITADKIAGNPSKYVGDAVELHCTVSNVPQEGVVNAACGDNDTNIVLEYDDTNSLDQGQAVRVLGTVDPPSEGTNAMGGTMDFPTVKVEFME